MEHLPGPPRRPSPLGERIARAAALTPASRVRDDPFRRRRCSLSRAGDSRQAARPPSSARHRERAVMALEAIRARLSLDEQGLLALRIDHGLDWESVAAILSNGDPISPAALRKRFERLKERIRKIAVEVDAL